MNDVIMAKLLASIDYRKKCLKINIGMLMLRELSAWLNEINKQVFVRNTFF